jgi:hypothetical protein
MSRHRAVTEVTSASQFLPLTPTRSNATMAISWKKLRPKDWDAQQALVVECAKIATRDCRPALDMWQLQEMESIHRTWSWSDYVPSSFLPETSGETMVEPEAQEPRGTKRKLVIQRETLGSASRHEPKRRLLSSQFPVRYISEYFAR